MTSTGLSTLVDRLRSHRTLGRIPERELQWLAEHGKLLAFAPGAVVSPKGQPNRRYPAVVDD